MAHFATDRPVTVTMMTAVLLLFGVVSVFSLPKDLFPDISKPALTIVTEYEGASSGELTAPRRTILTRPLPRRRGHLKRRASSLPTNVSACSAPWSTGLTLAGTRLRGP